MSIKAAVVERIKDLCTEKNMAINALATTSGITPSTVYSLLGEGRKDVGIATIKKLADGFGITIVEFFDCPLFYEIEQELK